MGLGRNITVCVKVTAQERAALERLGRSAGLALRRFIDAQRVATPELFAEEEA